ncbi:MAG: hypothetical protein RLZZ236_1397 [Bacteroidota bacterium]
MKKIVLIIVFTWAQLSAQTGIGTTTPNASAKLEVYSDNKGFLPPRVSLTGIGDATTIPSPATGLLVYCKGDGGLAAGYYYWNGNAWATIATTGGSGSFASSYLRGSRISTQSIAVGGVVAFTNIDNSAGNDISLNTTTGKITLAAGNTYRLRGAVPNFSAGQRPAFIWFNETTGANIGSASFSYNPADAAALGTFGTTAELVFTPNVTTVVSLRLLSSLSSGNVTVGGNGDFSVTGSYPWFDVQVISGNAPVTGQSVDYAIASLSTNQSISAVGNVSFNTIQGAGITLINGGFNLLANKTYKLEAALGGTSGGYAYYGWVDSSNTLLPGGSIGVIMKAGSAYTDAPQDKAVVMYTPTANTTVYLRVLNVNGGVVAYAPPVGNNYSSTWATIQQVGSSAIINPWILAGNNIYNTFGNVGIGNTSPAVALDVNGALNLSNTTTTPSITVKNGDAALAYGDNAQIKMGWAGSPAGSSQYAQYIHTRHNAGPTENGIDFYLSDGTPNNTITNGSKRAMSITSPGDVDITGKLTIGNPSGNVSTKLVGRVTAGTFLTFENLKFSVTTSGQRGLSIATVSGTVNLYVEGKYNNGNAYGSRTDTAVSYTTTPSGSPFGWGFLSAGDTIIYHLTDADNSRMYRVTLIIMPSYINNFIAVERLL